MEERGRSSMSSESVCVNCVKPEPESVFNEQVHVKEEAQYTKVKEEWDDRGAALADLYAGHEVKDELVLGPEGLQPPDIVFTLRAAQVLDVRKKPVLRDCVVRLERIDDHKTLFCIDTSCGTVGRAESLMKYIEHNFDMEKELRCSASISTEKETFECDICEKNFTVKTRLMEHVMTHAHQSTEQAESGCNVTDNVQALDVRRQPVLRDCVVRLERIDDHKTLFCTDTCRGTAGRATRLTSHADNTSAQPQDRDTDVTTEGTERETYICDICKKRFTLKTQLVKHIMVHAHQSSGREESRRGVADSAGQTSDGRERPVPRDCVVRLERVVGHEAPLSSDTCRGTAGRAARLTSHADNTSAQPQHRDTDVATEGTERETYICDICKKRFSLKTQLVEHIMVHIHRSSGQEESRRGVADRVPAGAGASRRGQQGARLLKARERTRAEAQPHSCGICEKKFRYLSELKKHERTHTDEKHYSCEICKQKFRGNSSLTYHRRTHTGEKPHSCRVCKQKYTRSQDLKIHEQIHTGEKPYACRICKQKFKENRLLNYHKRIHTGEKPYTCGRCDKKFSRTSNLRTHERTHTGDKPYSCRVCKQKYTRSDYLKIHERTHTGDKPYSCSVCKQKFTRLDYLKIHERTHTGDKPHSCRICEKKFTQISDLKRHKRTHTGEKPYVCGICEKKFNHSSNLKLHQRTHTGDKPYVCGICEKRFTLIGGLKRHKRTHTGEKPYCCGICEKKFTQIGGLIRHKRTHTGEKPYACAICKQKFKEKHSLNYHKRIHTGEKPYTCGTCEKKFSQTSNLRTHERTHTGDKPYSCRVCKQKYTQSGHLKIHERTHTWDKPHSCRICEKKFTRISGLKKHERTHREQTY